MTMSASLAKRFRETIPWGLLGCLALMVAVERFVAHHDLEYMSSEQMIWKISGHKAGRRVPSCEVLCMGDSLMKLGVVPKLVEGRCGRRAYNLAINGSQAPATYFLLRRLLDAGVRPKAVLVDFFPRLLEIGPRHSIEQWPHFLHARECVELCWVARDAGLFASIAVGRTLPSYRVRRWIRKQVTEAFAGRSWSNREENLLFFRNWGVNHGAQVMPSKVNLTQDFAAWRRVYFRGLWYDPINDEFLRRFLALAAAHRLPVVWLVLPMKPALQAECEQSGFNGELTRSLRATQDRSPNVVVIDGRRANYDPAVFFDPHHLGREGAFAYSTALGNVLRHLPLDGSPGPRWIDLPAYVARPIEPPLEDIDQSRLVLANPAPTRRR